MILKIPLKTVIMDGEGCHIFIQGKINSRDANLLVDTGASKTVFDLKRIQKFVNKKKRTFESFGSNSTGLGTTTLQSHFTIVDEFCISDLILQNYQAILLDMKHVNRSYKMLGLPPIDGVIGSDMLLKYKAVIDYEQEILRIKI